MMGQWGDAGEMGGRCWRSGVPREQDSQGHMSLQ